MGRRPTDDETRELADLARTFSAAGYGGWVLLDIADAAEALIRSHIEAMGAEGLETN